MTDESKKREPKLRFVAVVLAVGFCILFVGLWWVQVVSSRQYQTNLETQSYRTVRLPAVRVVACLVLPAIAGLSARYIARIYRPPPRRPEDEDAC